MSQSFLQRPKTDEEFYVELQDDGGFNISWGVGKTERDASDEAERRWAWTFTQSPKPTRKTIRLRRKERDK